MSSSNTDLLSNNETTTKVALSSDNAEAEMQVATLVKALKDGAKMDASYEAIFKGVMKNAKSRDALMKAMTDNMKLSQSMAADSPKAVEITSGSDFKASAAEPTGVVKKLTPPFGTKGFSNQVYQVHDTDWILDVYAYRHASSNDVTVVVLHSGSTPASSFFTVFTLWTTPATAHKFHYPIAYDSELGDGKFSYHIEYTHDINMIGPDGKNPIPVELVYNETFISQLRGTGTEPPYLTFSQLPGRIHGMSVFNASFEVGASIYIELVQEKLFFAGDKRTGTIQVSV
ncbi:hypothetical protein BDP27DRAFT_1346191 [Rhodocollybia butyracea]|uniref:Uncharacterized protein n=1 Tax=Rhodocollybia butyracea TaxID=206335 RepID=A0A9P5P8N4_9AGAR|nr:hypothetical protein BDP27DRAFT_1346191 [Rhodocollybia butyracea]